MTPVKKESASLPSSTDKIQLTKADSCPAAVVGHLAGMNFVFSGLLPSVGRDPAEDMVKVHGGKVCKRR